MIQISKAVVVHIDNLVGILRTRLFAGTLTRQGNVDRDLFVKHVKKGDQVL